MILVTSNRARQLLFLGYIGTVTREELQQCRADLEAELAGMQPGFQLLVDLTHLAAMSTACTDEIGRNMEMLDRCGVGLVARVIPDPYKDIGMNILTLFHYPHHPRVLTCDSMAEGVKAVLS